MKRPLRPSGKSTAPNVESAPVVAPLRCRYGVFLTLLLLVATGCQDYQTQLPTVDLRIGSRTFKLEIADEPTERHVGLMRRDAMPGDHGMIFVFPDDHARNFHMKNTRIALDILFLDARGSIVAIRQMKPYIGTASSGAPARYAIELNEGTAASLNVKEGDVVTLPPAISELRVKE